MSIARMMVFGILLKPDIFVQVQLVVELKGGVASLPTNANADPQVHLEGSHSLALEINLIDSMDAMAANENLFPRPVELLEIKARGRFGAVWKGQVTFFYFWKLRPGNLFLFLETQAR